MKNLVKKKLNYELETLETIISKDLALLVRNKCDIPHELIEDFYLVMREETDLVKENIRHITFYLKDNRSIEMHIQFHQQALIGLAGQLLQYTTPDQLNKPSAGPTVATLSHTVYHAIQDLLMFIEFQFANYLDRNAYIPSSYRLILTNAMQDGLVSLRAALAGRNISEALLHIVFLPFTTIIKDTGYVSYQHVIYLGHLKEALVQICCQPQAADMNHALNILLHSINFNSPEYANYYLAYIQRSISDGQSAHHDAIRELERHRKIIIQTPICYAYAFQPNLPGLADRLCDCIDAEIAYLQKISIPEEDVEHSPEHDAEPDTDFKIDFSLNNVELTYLFRLLLATRVCTTFNKKALSIFIPKVFRTRRKQIASHTMRKKFYHAETNTKRVIKAVLQKMIAFLDTDEGGALPEIP